MHAKKHMQRVSVNGVSVYPFHSKQQIIEYLHEVENGILFAVNARKIMTSPDYIKEAINDNIGYIDGYGAIWALRRKGFKGELSRMPGVELWLQIIENFTDRRYYLIGSRQDIINNVVNKLEREYPGINIVGYRDGYFNSDEYELLKQDIQNRKPDFIFVAMGSPKQEDIMIDLYKNYKAVYMGLGGSFDVYSGKVNRAPAIIQKLGLEGPYRFTLKPTRLFDRKIFYFEYFWKLLLGRF